MDEDIAERIEAGFERAERVADGSRMMRVIGGSLATVAGAAILIAEIAFSPWLWAQIDGSPGSAKWGVVAMLWTATIALLMVALGLRAIFARPRTRRRTQGLLGATKCTR